MLKKVNYEGKELLITYRNDAIFKRTLASNDAESREILNFVLEAVTGRKYRNTVVTNSESLGKYVFEKRHYLDIRAEDEDGNIFNVEMQQSGISSYDIKRFQGYIYRIVGNEIESGDSYENMKPAVQIVFTTGKFEEGLITEYKQRTISGKDMPNNLASFYFVSLSEIENIIEKKRKRNEEISNLEVLSYIFQKDANRAIMELADDKQKRVIKLMEKKYEESTQKKEILDEATEIAYYEQYIEAKYRYYLDEGREKGMQQGLQEGLQEGLQQGLQQGLQEGLQQGILKQTQKLITGLYMKDSDWLSECTLEQINLAFDLALKNVDYNELKNKVLKSL